MADNKYVFTGADGVERTFIGDRPPTDAEMHALAGAQTPDYRASNEKNAAGNAVVDPNTVGTVIRHWWDTALSPGQLLPFPKAAGGSGTDHPLMPGGAADQYAPKFVRDMHATKQQADALWTSGDHVGATTKYVESVIPLLGPFLSHMGDEAQRGKWAALLGETLGMVTPEALGTIGRVAADTAPAQTIADAADRASTQRVVDVIAPKVGPNKTRFGAMAEDVAPTIARETTGLTRERIATSVADRLDAATEALDSAAGARDTRQVYPTAPLLHDLAVRKSRLTAETARVDDVAAGADVVPTPNAARAAMIDQASNEIQQLGAYAPYESLRRIRQAYDGPARAVYSPAVTADFLKAQGGKLGAADVTGVIRDHLAAIDPTTATANAEYSLWKKASDVLDAAHEVEVVRPKMARSIIAQASGAMIGARLDGGLGAAVGAVVAPLLERGVMALSPAGKMFVARRLAALSDALRTGQPASVDAALVQLRRAMPAAAVATPAGGDLSRLPAAAQTDPGDPPRQP